jgi:divalent metal cation (Fe/Co/Zn/Cd) transporter
MDALTNTTNLLPSFLPSVTLWAVRMSALPPDDDHPYGHGRFEAVGSLGVSILLRHGN